MASLSPILLENIFSLIPYRTLLLICSRVCKSWSHVILNSAYMPFRTLYHRLIWDSHTLFHSPLLGDDDILSRHHASYIVKELCCNKYNILDGRYCMRGVLDMIEKKVKNWSRIGQEKRDAEIFELLSDHPLYTSTIKAVALQNKVWSLVTAIAMLSRDTDEILHLLQVPLRMCPTATVMDIFYGYAAIFLFCSQHYRLSNIHHYKVHSALYLAENIILHPEQISCEQALLINHVPRAGETLCVEYVPGVDLVGVVLKMVRRHSNLRYLIVDSQPSSSLLMQLPPNAVRAFSICNPFSYDVLVLMPDSTDIKRDDWGKVKEISLIMFRNRLSRKKNHLDNLTIIVYPLMLSLRNQDLCWIMYSIMRQHNVINSYIPVNIETYQQEEKSCEEKVLVVFPDILTIYKHCYNFFCCNSSTDFLIITIDEKLDEFLDGVRKLYDFFDGAELAELGSTPPWDFRGTQWLSAYYLTGGRTDSFIDWLYDTKCTFDERGEYHPSLNFITFTDILTNSQTMPYFSLVRLYKGDNEIDMVTTIINNLKFDVLEIQLYNFLDGTNNNTFLGNYQLATCDEINMSRCVYCFKSLKDEFFALKHTIKSVSTVARFTCFNSSDFICDRCAYKTSGSYHIFDNLKYLLERPPI